MKNLVKVLSVAVIIGLLFTLGGCGSIGKKITNEVKTKISEQLDETTDRNSDNTDATEADATAAENTDSTKADSTAITTSDGKGMDWPTKNMGISPRFPVRLLLCLQTAHPDP